MKSEKNVSTLHGAIDQTALDGLDQLLASCVVENHKPDWLQLEELVARQTSANQVWRTLGSDGSKADLQERLDILHRTYPKLKSYKDSLHIRSSLLPESFSIYIPIARFMYLRRKGICQQQARAALFGINGGQGSGKTTINAFLQIILSQGFGLRTAGFSIDDVYKTYAERQAMGQEVHPLFAIRSVAGTHDVALAKRTLHQLLYAKEGESIAIPHFDKMAERGQGDRLPKAKWSKVNGPVDVIIFEGWFVGARAQPESDLITPINQREAEQDPSGIWRQTMNKLLATEYRELFSLIDELLVIQIRSMEDVFYNRELQEQHLRRQLSEEKNRGTRGAMSPEEVIEFISLYERTTRHMLITLPNIAKLILYIGDGHRIERLKVNR